MIGPLFMSWVNEEEEEDEPTSEQPSQQQQKDEEAQDGPRAGASHGGTAAQDLSRSAPESHRSTTRKKRPLQEKLTRRKKPRAAKCQRYGRPRVNVATTTPSTDYPNEGRGGAIGGGEPGEVVGVGDGSRGIVVPSSSSSEGNDEFSSTSEGHDEPQSTPVADRS